MLNLKQTLPFPVPTELIQFISEHVDRDGLSVINFRSNDYHPQTGGFRPVEIMVEKLGDNFAVVYYTEFSYFGQGSFAELGKSNDFDFRFNTFFSPFLGELPLDDGFGEVFELFVKNTLNYAELGCFDEVKVGFMGGHLMLHKDLIKEA